MLSERKEEHNKIERINSAKLIIISLIFALFNLQVSKQIRFITESLVSRYYVSSVSEYEHSPPHTRPPNLTNGLDLGFANHFGVAENTEIKEVRKKLEIYDHIVAPGESAYKIAKKYGVSLETIYSANPKIKDWGRSLKPGYVLKIPSLDGIFYQVQAKDTLAKLLEEYKIGIENILVPGGESFSLTAHLKKGVTLFLAGAKPKKEKKINSEVALFIPPVKGKVVSRFGLREHPLGGGNGEGALQFHGGIDIAAPYGTPFVASASGRVSYAGWYGNLGYTVIVKHGNHFTTVYGHAASLSVRSGQRVSQGQVIGRVGCSGRATGPHLHFEIRKYGVRVNPLKYISFR